MTKSERLTARIETLEREYRSLLTQALTDCAADPNAPGEPKQGLA